MKSEILRIEIVLNVKMTKFKKMTKVRQLKYEKTEKVRNNE